jgi:hypothetical protein
MFKKICQSPKRRKRRPLTKDTIYRPKHLTLRNYNCFITPFIDKFNWGCINGLGEKSFKFSIEVMESFPYRSCAKLREKPHRNPKYRDITLSDHLQAVQRQL